MISSYLVLAGIILTALPGWLKGRQNADKIAEVHVLVNAQLSAVVSRVAQLVSTLEHAGVPMPPIEGEPGTAQAPAEAMTPPGPAEPA
jgi:hypothetical protein